MLFQFSYIPNRLTQILLILVGFCSTTHAAHPLADHVPGDAVVYIGWAGSDSQSALYRTSDLSAFIDHSNLPDLAREYLPKLWDQLAGESDENKQTAIALQKALPLLWHHPVAIYISNVNVQPDGTPNATLALVCDAASDAVELKSDFEQAIKDTAQLHLTMHDPMVMLGVNQSADTPLASTLADNPAFRAAMKKLQSSPAIAAYVDGKTMLQKADESAEADPNASEIWPKIRDALGIAGVKSFAMTCGFDGNGWTTVSQLEAPSPRAGLLAAIEPKPIDSLLLSRIPSTAGSVSVYNLDLAKLYDTVADVMAASSQSDTTFHQATGLATMALGRNLRRQILAPLGSQWVLYSDAKIHSAVLMNHPGDADTAGDSLVSATFGLVNLANSQIPGAATQPVVNADQSTVKSVDITSAVTKYASPSFAVKGGILYFGLAAESVVTAATLPASTTAGDVLHSTDFLVASKQLGVSNFASFDYCDLPITAPRAYDNFGPAGAQLRQVMSMFGITIPKIELPPLDQLKTHLSPALSVAWADGDGIYSKSISPFPLAACLFGDPQQTMVSATTVSAVSAVLMPAFERARASAAMVETMSQERQILLGLITYATSHHGVFPADLGTLIVDGDIARSGLKIFLMPRSKIHIPNDVLTGSKDVQAKWVNDHAEFIFLLPNHDCADAGAADTAVVVPKDAERATALVPVGFADGHCEACKPDRVRHFLHPDAGN